MAARERKLVERRGMTGRARIDGSAATEGLTSKGCSHDGTSGDLLGRDLSREGHCHQGKAHDGPAFPHADLKRLG